MTMTTKKQVINFLTSWKDGILNIRKSYIDKHDYKEEALSFVKNHYLFEVESVLFKPTLTKSILFRNDINSALSYFIGGSPSFQCGLSTSSLLNKQVCCSSFNPSILMLKYT